MWSSERTIRFPAWWLLRLFLVKVHNVYVEARLLRQMADTINMMFLGSLYHHDKYMVPHIDLKRRLVVIQVSASHWPLKPKPL